MFPQSACLTCRPFESADWTAPFRCFSYFSQTTPFQMPILQEFEFRQTFWILFRWWRAVFVRILLKISLFAALKQGRRMCEVATSSEVRRYKKLNMAGTPATKSILFLRWNTAWVAWMGHVPPHNPVYIRERYKSYRQLNILQGESSMYLQSSSFTWWGPFSSCYFSYITSSQMIRAWWAPKLQKIH